MSIKPGRAAIRFIAGANSMARPIPEGGSMPAPEPAILIGLNYRDFPSNWRPARDEIAFARARGFVSMQFHGREHGLTDEQLGDPAATVGALLREAGVVPVMEIIVRVDLAGRTSSGLTPIEV